MSPSRHTVLVILVLIAIILLQNVQYSYAQPIFNFAYLEVSNSVSTFKWLDTTRVSGFSNASAVNYSIDDNLTFVNPALSATKVSPDGTWVATLLDQFDSDFSVIQLFNPNNGEARQIQISRTIPESTHFQWSPNSQYLAFLTVIDDSNYDLYVFNMVTNEIQNISQDTYNQRDIGWSSDSTRLMTFADVCDFSSTSCVTQLEVYAINGDVIPRIAMVPLDIIGPSCNPVMSPSNTYVAFTSYCFFDDPGYAGYPSEIALYTINNQPARLITDFSRPDNRYFSTYDYTWLDNETLLIGADYRVIGVEEGHQLQTYNVTTGTTTVLSTALGAGFSVNPVTQEVLLRPSSSEFTPAQLPSADAAIPLSLMEITDLENASTMSMQAVDRVSVPLTTDWVWSPDGAYAYGLVLSTLNDADTGSFTVAFLDGRTQQVTQQVVRVTGDPASSYLIPIGWVRR